MKKYIFYIALFLFFLGASYGITLYYLNPIPKIIHYVWLGKTPLPQDVQEAIISWKKYAPDYKIMRWDETNCPINDNDFIRSTYNSKLYSWSSDFCRFYALNKYGGFYFDTDFFLKKPLEKYVNRKTPLILGYENNRLLGSCFIAANKGNPFVQKVLAHYKTTKQFQKNGPLVVSAIFKETYPKIPLNGKFYQSPDVTLHASNEVMLDYGGPENFSMHAYNASNTPLKKGAYYRFYIKDFLEQNGIKIQNGEQEDFLLPIRNEGVYLLSSKKRGKIQYSTTEKIQILFNDNTTVIFDKIP